ncbi:hypothetical protein [Synechococcus sp. MIT S9507]|uniref:hypothetical protein n=1 Tax=Synechococcus sp. MIT S9507 TaxID=3082544 RepID=UPI0039B50A8E
MKNYVAIGTTSLISALLFTANPAVANTDKQYISLCTEEVREKMKNPYTFRVRASAVTQKNVNKTFASLGKYDTLVQLNTTGTNSYGAEIANTYMCGFEAGTLYFVVDGNDAGDSYTTNGRKLDLQSSNKAQEKCWTFSDLIQQANNGLVNLACGQNGSSIYIKAH